MNYHQVIGDMDTTQWAAVAAAVQRGIRIMSGLTDEQCTEGERLTEHFFQHHP